MKSVKKQKIEKNSQNMQKKVKRQNQQKGHNEDKSRRHIEAKLGKMAKFGKKSKILQKKQKKASFLTCRQLIQADFEGPCKNCQI